MGENWYKEPAVLDPELVKRVDLTFYKQYTRQSDENNIRNHVHQIWETCVKDSVKYPVYKCVRELMFLQPRISSHKRYAELVSESTDKNTKRVLEIGACFGTDTRKLVLEGILPENIVSVDVVDPYWHAGLDLFMDTHTLSVHYLVGDIIVDHKFADAVSDTLSRSDGRGFDIVWSGFVFHVLDRTAQEGLVKRVFSLMESGGWYFGTCVGNTEGSRIIDQDGYKRFINSADTCKELLEAVGFGEVEVCFAPDYEDLGGPNPKSSRGPGHCLLQYAAKKP